MHGCGGVGLSAVMIAAASGARVVAVDVSPRALDLARKFGAAECLDATGVPDTAAAVQELTGGGAHLSSTPSARPPPARPPWTPAPPRPARPGGPAALGGRHHPVPLARAIALELELLGSHGMAAHAYPGMLELVGSGVLRPDLLITRTIPLDAVPEALAAMGTAPGAGVTVIEPWS
ncbi:zinc-binding dehydrogenase [Streptomyces diastatochromogenes]|nr:zinc-binding dehydrogenase [Streptomyces diastatochromogenes]